MYDNNKKREIYLTETWAGFIGGGCEIIACIILAFQGSTSDWITEHKNNAEVAYQQQKRGDLSIQRVPRQDF